ncbi:MAG TPA: ABC transporter permease subunit [Thermoanaerobaculia bacterium]|nr:ABC transporter permease subunit [Thermoanaerobaculia bacterium]
MAVYERTYRRYEGELTPARSRFLILPRYAYQEVFKSKAFIAFLALCALSPLGFAIVIYLHHNLQALKAINLPLDKLVPIDATFFSIFVTAQSFLAFLLAFAVGPGLISADVRNNALPLYLSRPFSRSEYVLGKMSVLLILLSAITWIPGLLLFLLQTSLEGTSWGFEHAGLAWAILASCWEWILVLSLLTLALSAWVKWKPVARIALLAVFFVTRGFGEAVDRVLDTEWGSLVSLGKLNEIVRADLFGTPLVSIPVWTAWLALGLVALACLAMLARRVRAYEVVR